MFFLKIHLNERTKLKIRNWEKGGRIIDIKVGTR